MISSGRQCDKCSASALFVSPRYDLALCGHHLDALPDNDAKRTFSSVTDSQPSVSDSPVKPEAHGYTADDSLVSAYNGESAMDPDDAIGAISPATPIEMSDCEVNQLVEAAMSQIASAQCAYAVGIGQFHHKVTSMLMSAAQDKDVVMRVLDVHPSMLHERDIPDNERHV